MLIMGDEIGCGWPMSQVVEFWNKIIREMGPCGGSSLSFSYCFVCLCSMMRFQFSCLDSGILLVFSNQLFTQHPYPQLETSDLKSNFFQNKNMFLISYSFTVHIFLVLTFEVCRRTRACLECWNKFRKIHHMLVWLISITILILAYQMCWIIFLFFVNFENG